MDVQMSRARAIKPVMPIRPYVRSLLNAPPMWIVWVLGFAMLKPAPTPVRVTTIVPPTESVATMVAVMRPMCVCSTQIVTMAEFVSKAIASLGVAKTATALRVRFVTVVNVPLAAKPPVVLVSRVVML